MKELQRRPVPAISAELSQYHPVIQRIYASRGIESSLQLARGAAQLLPFTLLKGISAAITLLIEALQQQQHIVIVGDFDADGATSTATLLTGLKSLGFKHVEYLVPNLSLIHI